MPRASPIQYNLNAGEWSPLLAARVDQDKFRNSLTLCRNFVPLVQGGLTRRPGTRFIREVKDQSSDDTKQTVRLVPFQFSVQQAYTLEVGHEYIRFYTQDGILLDGSSNPVEVATPYDWEDVEALAWAQSADILYLVHPDYAPRQLTRTSPTAFSLSRVEFEDGPYRPVNTDTSVTAEFDGTDTVTFSTDPMDGPSEEGRPIRIYDDAAGEWVWFRITGSPSPGEYTVTNPTGHGSMSATDLWRLGAWGGQDAMGEFPANVIFFENRLWLSGAPALPQRVDGSSSGDFLNFAPTDPNGDVNADNAISVTLNSDQVNAVRWLSVSERGLLIGTTGSEWILRRATQQTPLTPSNLQATNSTQYGSARVRPIRTGEVTLFVQRDIRTLRELVYNFNVDGFRASDLTVLSQHLMREGIKEFVYQQAPQKTVWVVTANEALLSLTYERDQEVTGWARHDLGGRSRENLGADFEDRARVQSVAVIPSADALTDELWMVVRRHIDGDTWATYVEKSTPIWEGSEDQEDAWFVDSGLDYDGSATDTVSGLDHLEGETVKVLANGAVHPDVTVTSGQITLDYEAERIIAGLGYTSEIRTQRLEAGAADGTAQGKIKRIHRVIYRFFQSLGGYAGPDEQTLQPLIFRTTSDNLGEAVPLFTGDKFVDWEGDYEREGQIYLKQEQPLPMTLLAIMPQVITQDGG